MRITKPPYKERPERYLGSYLSFEQAAANTGCDTCPYCNTDKDAVRYRHYYTGIIRRRRIDGWKCRNCKGEWESEPFKIGWEEYKRSWSSYWLR